jgi:hypothetical protein
MYITWQVFYLKSTFILTNDFSFDIVILHLTRSILRKHKLYCCRFNETGLKVGVVVSIIFYWNKNTSARVSYILTILLLHYYNYFNKTVLIYNHNIIGPLMYYCLYIYNKKKQRRIFYIIVWYQPIICTFGIYI